MIRKSRDRRKVIRASITWGNLIRKSNDLMRSGNILAWELTNRKAFFAQLRWMDLKRRFNKKYPIQLPKYKYKL